MAAAAELNILYLHSYQYYYTISSIRKHFLEILPGSKQEQLALGFWKIPQYSSTSKQCRFCITSALILIPTFPILFLFNFSF